jgi:MFS family permease
MNQKAKKILRPLYAWAFIEALIFWYAIEKLLWTSSGITPDQVILLGIIAQTGQVLIEVPSSIIADRWSRRKTLIAASVFMLGAISIVLMTQTFMGFVAMSLAWAFYFAFRSGTINAYVYDLLKEHDLQQYYRKAMSRYATYELLGLLVSSLASSALIIFGGLLIPYWATIPPTIIAILILMRMHDPSIERTHESTGTAMHHVRSAVRQITKQRWVTIIFLALALLVAGRFVWYEYYQLYAINRQVPAVLFGAMLALIHIGNLLGAEFAHRVRNPRIVMHTAFGLLLLSSLALAVVTGSIFIIMLLVVSFFGSQAVDIVLDENLQHQISSELRATTLSLTGLISRSFFGLGALVIILFGATPEITVLVATVLFAGSGIYILVRKRLVTAAE